MTRRTIIYREDAKLVCTWLLRKEGGKVHIARSEFSDDLEVPLEALPALIADLQELGSAPE